MTDLDYDPHRPLPIEERRRRLVFRSWHRGIKELDLIFGNFVEMHIDNFGEDELTWFERLYEEQDHSILSWITGGDEPCPEAFQCEMMQRLQKLDFLDLQA